jgi:integrase
VSVYKRGNTWWTKLSVGGVQIRRSLGTDKRAEAVELEAQIRTRLAEDRRRGLAGLAPRRTLEEALARWLEGEAVELKSYRHIVNNARMLRPYLKGKWLEDGPAVAAEYIEKNVGHLKPATINQRLAIIRRLLRLAYLKWEWLKHPLHSKVILLPPRNERHVYLTLEEVEVLARAAADAGDGLRLLAYTGLRVGEAYRAKRIEDDQGTRLVLDANTKSGRPRMIPLPEFAAALPCPPAVSRSQLRDRFEKARAAIGRPELHLHDLRHTYASLLIQGGASPAQVRDLLGHCHLGVTSRYAHLRRDDLWEAVARLGTSKGARSAGPVGHKKGHRPSRKKLRKLS